MPAKWAYAKDGTLSWVCGFAIYLEGAEHSRRLRADELAVLAGGAGDPSRGRLLVTNKKAIALAPPDYTRLPGVEYVDQAIPETHPPDYQAWVRAFQDFKSQ